MTGIPETEVDEALMNVHFLFVDGGPWAPVPAVFKATRHFAEEAETIAEVQVHMQKVTLQQVGVP
ncbi:MAG TPA: hypothetical protein VJ723_06965 [Candidatus Angelobacter sp.]|nr:hypothetical protein [Candidatus Angelobacter sp.]